MGCGGSAGIFQAQMMDLMASLEYVRAYIDDLLIIMRGILDDHLSKMENVLTRLCDDGLKINAAKPTVVPGHISGIVLLVFKGIRVPPVCLILYSNA